MVTNTKCGTRTGLSATSREAEVRRLSIARRGGRCDGRAGILAAFVALAGTMEVAVAQGTAGAPMGNTAETVDASLREGHRSGGHRRYG